MLKADKIFLPALVTVHAVFLLLALHYGHIYNGDSLEYIYAAVNIKDHGLFYSGSLSRPLVPELLTFRTPLYPLLLAAIYCLAANNWIVIVLQHVLSVCDILLLRKGLVQLGYTSRYDWLLLLLLVAYPAQFMHAGIIEPEILLQFFVLLYVYQLLLFFKTKKTKHAWMMSLALAAGLFTKPVLYPYTILHVLLICLMVFRRRAGFPHPWRRAVIAVLPLCAIFGYNAWNEARTGKFHFTSNQSFNAVYYFYFYKSSTEGIASAKKFLREEREKMAAMPAFKDRYDYANRRGKALLKENFPGYIVYHLKHSLRFFVDPGKGDMDLFTGRLTYNDLYTAEGKDYYSVIREYGWWEGNRRFLNNNPAMIPAGIVFLFNLARIAGLLLFVRSRQAPAGVRWFTLFFLAYFALLTGPIATPRYVLPVSLVYTGAAVLGFMFAGRRRKKAAVVEAVH